MTLLNQIDELAINHECVTGKAANALFIPMPCRNDFLREVFIEYSIPPSFESAADSEPMTYKGMGCFFNNRDMRFSVARVERIAG